MCILGPWDSEQKDTIPFPRNIQRDGRDKGIKLSNNRWFKLWHKQLQNSVGKLSRNTKPRLLWVEKLEFNLGRHPEMAEILFLCFLVIYIFVTAFLRDNSHAIQLTHVKYTIRWLLLYAQICGSITTFNFRTFHYLKKKSHPL